MGLYRPIYFERFNLRPIKPKRQTHFIFGFDSRFVRYSPSYTRTGILGFRFDSSLRRSSLEYSTEKMSSTLLEQTRSNHEEIERLERLVVQDLQTEPSSSKDRLVQGHRVRNTIHSIMRTTEKLVSLCSSSFHSLLSLSALCFGSLWNVLLKLRRIN